jgi:hypothetical protein
VRPGVPVRPISAPVVGDERREASEADRTYSLGPRWVRAVTVEHGHERSPTVTDGSEKPQVAGLPAHAAGIMEACDSDCGPEGQGCRAEAADEQQPTAVGITTTAEESWRIVGGSRAMHLLSPAAFHRSLPISTPSMYMPVQARWI